MWPLMLNASVTILKEKGFVCLSCVCVFMLFEGTISKPMHEQRNEADPFNMYRGSCAFKKLLHSSKLVAGIKPDGHETPCYPQAG